MAGTVAAGHPQTAEAAQRILGAGGNAVDAAVAATLASFVSEPLLTGAGGGGLLLAWDPDAGPLVIDFFPRGTGVGITERTTALDFHPIEIDFGAATQSFQIGRASVACPSVLDGLALAAAQRGRLGHTETERLARLVEPAVEMAERGVVIGQSGADVFHLLWSIVATDEGTPRALCSATDGRPPRADELVANPELGGLLRRWAEGAGRTPEAFRRGLLDGFGVEAGGCITEADLDLAAASALAPRTIEFRDWTIWTSPRAGGEAIAHMLQTLGDARPTEHERALRLAESGRRVVQARAGARAPGSTTHVSVVDERGAVASVTVSNGEGSGFVIPGTGVHLNNFMGEADLHPEGFFVHAPGTPLPTMMAPTIARAPDGRVYALGTGGANRIRSAVVGTLDAMTRGASLREAILAPRLHAELDEVFLEGCAWTDPDAVRAALDTQFDARVEFDQRAFFFGGVHAVGSRGGESREAFGDPRRAGVVRSAD